jgi:hypothetical protein
MSFSNPAAVDNPTFLNDSVCQLESLVEQSAREGRPLREVERRILDSVLDIGRRCVDWFITLQGDGDLGETVTTANRTVLLRSPEPADRPLRTIFGEHVARAFVYGRGPKQLIELRPVDARMQLPEGRFSHLFQEFAQLFCVEQAFGPAAGAFQIVFGQTVSVNSLERVNQDLGDSAGAFLYDLPIPPAEKEGKILVLTADGKGVPMVRESTNPVPAFERREFPGNRKMAILAGVYSVDPHPRTPEQILDALFREKSDEPPPKRPVPVGKVIIGCLTRNDRGDGPMPADIQAFAWAAEQVRLRHQPGQPLIRLMDGQSSLWDTSAICLGDTRTTIDILDIIHVAGRIWEAAKLFHSHREHQEAFARDRLGRILNGQVGGVISGLRQQATKNQVSKKDRAAIERICHYFENNRSRMRYGDYLREGYPIATGVIEGACRHLVMDRMCRTGMRWTREGAQAMLHVRAVLQAGLSDRFHACHAAAEARKVYPHNDLLKNYQPFEICG